jgi:Asp/Glu/hydantoin racemase
VKRNIAFIHTSPAAIGPLMQFYSEAAPELQITNLLDDGLLRLLASKNITQAQRRLGAMIEAARETYRAELAMITCSSVSKEMAGELSRTIDIPILKIDSPLARKAVETGRRIGVAVTFPPTLETTSNLLRDAAAESGTAIEIIPEIVPDAYDALLAGDHKKHDDLLMAAIKRLDERKVDAIVLAQVSMARILPQLAGRARAPVLSSLSTSLMAIREVLKAKNE